MNTFPSLFIAKRRGSVMILVVAVLALLAVIGTVYVFSARTERASSAALGDAINLNLALEGAQNQIRTTLLNSTVRPQDGAILTLPPAWTPNLPTGSTYVAWSAGTPNAANSLVMGSDFRIYKCKAGNTPDLITHGPPPVNTTDWALFDPASDPVVAPRYYDYPERQASGTWTSFGHAPLDPAVPDEPWLAKDIITTNGSGDFGLLTNSRFDPSVGTQSLAYTASPPTAGDVTVVDPTPTTPIIDGIWNLLPLSSSNGARYRYAFRLVDTNRLANLNVGQVGNTAVVVTPPAVPVRLPDPSGQFLTSLFLGDAAIFAAGANDNITYVQQIPSASQNGVFGRGQLVTTPNPYSLISWQNELLGYERSGVNPAAGITNAFAQWFEPTDEIELRTYGTRGSVSDTNAGAALAGYIARPMVGGQSATPNPKMLGSTLAIKSANRLNYTTYSWDRNFSTVLSANCKWKFAAKSWPNNNTKLPILASDTTLQNANYLANALSASGYSDDEALSFALNYLAQADPTAKGSVITGSPLSLYVSDGTGAPSATVPITMTGTATGTPHNYYAFRAQPFLNEVAIAELNDGVSGDPQFTNFALELINPFGTLGDGNSINMNGWRIRVDGITWVADVGAAAITSPSRSLSVILSAAAGTGGLDMAAGATTVPVIVPLTGVDPSGPNPHVITLERPYYTTATPTYVVVDSLTYTFPQSPTGTPVLYSAQRNNQAAGPTPTAAAANAFDPWMADAPVIYGATTAAPTLGLLNSVVGDPVLFGLALNDRFYTTAAATAQISIVPSNVGDLQSLSRASIISDIASPPTIYNNLPSQFANTLGMWTTSGTGTGFPQESRIRFDYISDPRAQSLLTLFAMVDRASDGADQLGNGTPDNLNEVRLPGRINVNTANINVLRSLFGVLTADSAGAPNLPLANLAVANITAYRDRLIAQTFTFADGTTGTTTVDYSTAAFPGKGIRSLAELAIPLGFAQGKLIVSGARIAPTGSAVSLTDIGGNGNPATIFPKVFSACTVRSDSFILYGYLEAIRANPNLAVAHDNQADWYSVASDDVHEPTLKNIRLARQRWISIIDRSMCNFLEADPVNFAFPKIVITKTLPQ